MTQQAPETSTSIWNRLPSFVWIILIVGGIIALILGVIGTFYALSSIEGVASVLMLVVAWVVIRTGSSYSPKATEQQSSGSSIVTAMGISFFALMGLAIDQTGNPIYNQPIEWFFCPSGTELHRGVDVTNPRPGETVVTQDFTCVERGREAIVKQIGMFEVMGTRFVEYVLIGYLLIGLSRLYSRIRYMRRAEVQVG
jgi:hypothetical protein